MDPGNPRPPHVVQAPVGKGAIAWIRVLELCFGHSKDQKLHVKETASHRHSWLDAPDMSSRMGVNVYGHRLRCSNDLRSRVWDVIEAHVVGRVRGKFDQVVFELCYEEDSVLSMNVVGRRLTGRDTEALNLADSRTVTILHAIVRIADHMNIDVHF